jgi:hypothetical protein
MICAACARLINRYNAPKTINVEIAKTGLV